MKIFFLADAESSHTQKWVLSLLRCGVEIYLFSLNSISPELLKASKDFKLTVYSAKQGSKSNQSILQKLSYLKILPILSKEIKQFKPDLLHAHYITSYGLLAFLSGFKPYVLSVWGTDILVFPKKSKIHKGTVKMILNAASKVFSTSQLMIQELQSEFNYQKAVQIPFGVDIKTFQPKEKEKASTGIDFVIVKSLMPTYGIDIAIQGFTELVEKYPDCKSRLLIYGDGPERSYYESISGKLLHKVIFFKGKIPHNQVPQILQDAAVFVNVSRSESFGVSVLEAASCGLPVIVSKEGGLLETVLPNESALVLEELNSKECFKTMEAYMLSSDLRKKHGAAGRKFVLDKFDFQDSIKKQLSEYTDLIKNKD